MRTRRRLVVASLTLLLPLATSCGWFRKPARVPKPAQIPVQTEPATPPPPPPLEPPPEIPTTGPEAGKVPGAEPQRLPPPPAPAKRPSPAGPPVSGGPSPEPAAAPPAVPAPQLRPMLTAAQRQELERSFNERVRRTQSILASVGRRSLSGEMADLANQVRTFLKQAEEARETDLLRANNLAERAEVLAQDLANRLR